MSTASRPYPILQDLIESFASWVKHRRQMNEMRQLDRADFDRIASDLRIAPDDLEELVRHGRHSADELPKMLDQLSVSAGGIGRTQPLLLRDMERVCSLCNHKGQCDRELAEVTAAENYHGFCAMPRHWSHSIAPTSRRAERRQPSEIVRLYSVPFRAQASRRANPFTSFLHAR